MPNGNSENCENCPAHQEMECVKLLADETAKELAVIREVLNRLEKSLFGNGRPGQLELIWNKLSSHDKLIWVGMGFIAALEVLNATGLLHLKGL